MTNRVATADDLSADAGMIGRIIARLADAELLAHRHGPEYTMERIRLTSTEDASLSSTLHALQIGATDALNLIADNNEIQARNNGAASTLGLNYDGGAVNIGGPTNFRVAGVLGGSVEGVDGGVGARTLRLAGVNGITLDAAAVTATGDLNVAAGIGVLGDLVAAGSVSLSGQSMNAASSGSLTVTAAANFSGVSGSYYQITPNLMFVAFSATSTNAIPDGNNSNTAVLTVSAGQPARGSRNLNQPLVSTSSGSCVSFYNASTGQLAIAWNSGGVAAGGSFNATGFIFLT